VRDKSRRIKGNQPGFCSERRCVEVRDDSSVNR
jgi:hypothetical protein